MGYMTHYKLTVSSEPEGLRDAFDESSAYGDGMFDALLFGAEFKWYQHDDEMLAISRKFPDVLFTLSGMLKNRATLGSGTSRAERCRSAGRRSRTNRSMKPS